MRSGEKRERNYRIAIPPAPSFSAAEKVLELVEPVLYF
jgi:hypothetical protein